MTSSELKRLQEENARRLTQLRRSLDYDGKKSRVEDLEQQSLNPDLWNDPASARTLLKEVAELKLVVEGLERVSGDNETLAEFLEMASEGELGELEELGLRVRTQVDEIELKTMLSGVDDARNAILTINPGAGGTESEDWAAMLTRMYRSFFLQQGWKTEVLDEQPGEVTGVKLVTFHVSGKDVYGTLRSEIGVHRLVRISPFDSQARRHTSFASVYVYPELDDEIEIVIEDKDLRVDTYRASGAGGQHVNKTDSAIRITHLPTNIVVQCQNERSQLRNRQSAMKMLQARLYAAQREEERKRLAELEGKKADNTFGSQIRSYVLHPYNMVKDHRTGQQTSDTGGVLDGDLLPFIRAFLLNPDYNLG
ncbi:MAG: peptide chain release factor 2 [Candidatus Cloacimonetes bacterium]|nr:peptide chain release factor 2 [Candidatus Cloacimonadota bacterium]